MKFKRFLFLLVILLCAMSLSVIVFGAEASDITSDVKLTFENITSTRLTDGKITTSSAGKNVKIQIESESPLGGVWLRYSATPVGGYLDGDTKIAQNGFWSEFIPLEESSAILTFEEVSICEINVYSSGELPSDVQLWEAAQNETDIMLFASHSDDDQLFFAGLVPYYVARGDVDVKVCFFTTSYQDISRVQELLAGLWYCGLKNYPIILPLPDNYSETLATAEQQLKNAGYAHEGVCTLVRDVLNKYTPTVTVLHDFDGEYGHGMHKYSAKAVVDTVENASKNDFVPSKIYVHLFAQNEITLPIDEPLEAFGQKSAFNISQEAFQFHKSQHWTWFYDWIYGSRKEITAASQIKTYNPAKYGLYMSLVGVDQGNDMLENIETYAQYSARTQAELNAAKNEADATAPVETPKEEPSFNDEIEPTLKKKGISMRFIIFPIVVAVLVIATIFTVWVIEEKPFIHIDDEEE